MKNFPSLKKFLAEHRNVSESKLDSLKKEYYRQYHREYRKRLKREQSKKQVTIRLNQDEFKKITLSKIQHNKSSLASFIVKSAIAYIDQAYLPHNEDDIRKLILEINKIGNNVNQIVHKLHIQLQYKSLNGDWDDSMQNLTKLMVGYELLVDRVQILETTIREFVMSPPPIINGARWVDIKSDKDKLKALISHLLLELESAD